MCARALSLALVSTLCVSWQACFASEATPAVPAVAASETQPQTHKQIASLVLGDAGQNLVLKDFCVHREGQVLALVGPGLNQRGAPQGAEASPANRTEVRILSFVRKRDVPSTAELTRKWPLDFEAEAINISPAGVVYVGGAGKIASYQLDGTRIAEVEAPQIAAQPVDPAELRRQAEELLEAQQAARQEQIKQLEEAQRANEEKAKARAESPPDDDSPGQSPKRGKAAFKKPVLRLSGSMALLQSLRSQRQPPVEEIIGSILKRLSTINSISIGANHVFIASPETKGYGYSIWRTDLDLANARKIVSGLSGCCGQMDLQVAGDEVYVAENSRHRVVRYDSEGKKLTAFGKRDREGLGEGFGGCCNPMNLCFTSEGNLLVSESNGIVKRFTPDGKYLDMVGTAGVPEGCKNSAVGVSSNGDYVFYIDVRNSQIVVLERQPAEAAAAP